MAIEKLEYPAGRIIHLQGGCRAINNPGPTVDLYPNTVSGKRVQFQIREYATIYRDIESLGLNIIGVDFYSHVLEVEGSVPPNWRPFHQMRSAIWPVTEISQKWSNIGHAAFKRKNGTLWDIGSRIAHQLRVCSWRLREISESYHNQLNASVKRNSFEVGHLFEDGFTWLIYLSLQAFLIDACILRDYLAEFIANFIVAPRFSLENQKVTAMGSLKKVLNKITVSDELIEQLRKETDTNGWITALGNYRDLVMHSAPLAQAERKLFAVCDVLEVGKKGSLPAIRCPIPDNPAEIFASRSKGVYFKNFAVQFETFIKAAKGEIPGTDGINYAHASLKNLVELADRISVKSPVSPEMMILDSSNIIGPLRITNA